MQLNELQFLYTMPTSTTLVRESLQWQRLMYWLLVNRDLEAFDSNHGTIQFTEKYLKTALQYAKSMPSEPTKMMVSRAMHDLQQYSEIFLNQWKSICSKVHDEDMQQLMSTLVAPKIEGVLQSWKIVFDLWKEIYFDKDHCAHNDIKNQVSLILLNTGKKVGQKYLKMADISDDQINECLTSLRANYRSKVCELCNSVLFGREIKKIPFEIGDENLLNEYKNEMDKYEVTWDNKMVINLKAKHEALIGFTNDQTDENYSEIKMLLDEVAETLPDLKFSKPDNLLKNTSSFTESKKIKLEENPVEKVRKKLYCHEFSREINLLDDSNLDLDEPSTSCTVWINCEVPIPNGDKGTVEEQSNEAKAKVQELENLKKLQGEIMKSAKLNCLRQNEYLNDLIVKFCIDHTCLFKLSDKDREKSYFFDTFFYTSLLRPARDENSNYNTGLVKRKDDINLFDKDFLVFPINFKSHWFLVITCFLNTLTQKLEQPNDKPKNAFILVLDSHKTYLDRNRETILMNIIHYLGGVYYQANRETLVDIFTLKSITADVPQQKNTVDCGIYMIQFLQLFYEFPVTNENSFQKNLKHWHTLNFSNKREEISKIIENYQ